MKEDQIKNFSAEKLAHLYPIDALVFFNRTKASAYNFKTMKMIVNSHLKSLSSYRKLSILDWGCGNSLWSFGLFRGAYITGVDISKTSLFYSRLNAKKNCFNGKYQGYLVDQALKELKANSFDYAMSFGLVEMLNDNQLKFTFSNLYKLLKPGGKLFITHHNYKMISAAYLPYLFRGGYNGLKFRTGLEIQKKSTSEVISFFNKIGFKAIDFGGYCPYPSKLWPFVFANIGWLSKNKFISEWYYSRFIVFQKPFK